MNSAGRPAASSPDPAVMLWAGLSGLDDLVEAEADLDVLVAQAADLFDCVVGVRKVDGTVVCAAPHGERSPRAADDALTRQLRDGTEVWIAPAVNATSVFLGSWHHPVEHGPPAPAELILRRLAISVRATSLRAATRSHAKDMNVAIDPVAADEDRLPALRRLAFGGSAPVTLVALVGPADGVAEVIAQIRGRASVVHHTQVERVHLVMAKDFVQMSQIDVAIGVRVAHTPAAPALQAPNGWRWTVNALRFALPSTHAAGPYHPSEAVIVDSTAVGGYAVLAEQLTPEEIAQVDDVRRLGALCLAGGPEMLRTLLAVAATDSLRQAAKTVHMHHSSVAHRVERAEKVLGFACTEPYGRARLLLTLTLHRLLVSHQLF